MRVGTILKQFVLFFPLRLSPLHEITKPVMHIQISCIRKITIVNSNEFFNTPIKHSCSIPISSISNSLESKFTFN